MTPIDLNDDSSLVASKVHEIGTNRRLASKVKLFRQQCPEVPLELPLSVGHGAAKLTRSWNAPIDFADLSHLRHRRYPHPHPLPTARDARGGRGGVKRKLGVKLRQQRIREQTWVRAGYQLPSPHPLRRSISAPQRPSFSSSRSKPRSRCEPRVAMFSPSPATPPLTPTPHAH